MYILNYWDDCAEHVVLFILFKGVINCGEICDRAVKVLTEKFYCSIASIKLLRVLSLKFCFTLDRFGSKHQRNVVAWPLTLENISNWLLVWPRSQVYPQRICARHPLVRGRDLWRIEPLLIANQISVFYLFIV